MFNGFGADDPRVEDEIRISVNQGKFMLMIAEKIKNNEPLNDMERAWAIGIIEARGKDQINNAKKYISKSQNGAPADPRRYEAVTLYYSYLKVLKVQKRARDLVCYEYELSDESLKKWIKQEIEAGCPIKKQVDHHIINNPQEIIKKYKQIIGKK